MCWSGSRFSRRATASQKRASKSLSGTRCSSPRRTPWTQAASSSASWRGESTPDSARRRAAWAISARRRDGEATGAGDAGWGDAGAGDDAGVDGIAVTGPASVPPRRELRGRVRVDAGLDDGVQVPVQDLVEVVRLVADAVVGDPVLGEVVGPDALGA